MNKETEQAPIQPVAQGKHGRCAVKVIDPRGNEVMAVREMV